MTAAPDLVLLLAGARERVVAEISEGLEQSGFPGLGLSHALLLRAMGYDDVTITDLAARTRMTPQASAKLVNHLVVLGLVTKAGDSADGRRKRVARTDEGVRAAAEIRGLLTATERHWADLLGAPGLDAVRAALLTVVSEPGAAGSSGRRLRMRLG